MQNAIRVCAAMAAFALVAVPVRGADERETPWLGLVAGPGDGTGARVLAVVPGGPAENAGIRAGDVLGALGGAVVRTDRDLAAGLAGVRPGDRLSARWQRGSATIEGIVLVGSRADRAGVPGRSESPAQTFAAVPVAAGRGTVDVGVYTLAIPSELRVHLGAPADAGVLLSAVDPGSPAARAGLRVGDVLTRAGAEVLRSPADLYRAVLTAPSDQTVALVVIRDKNTRVLSLPPADGSTPAVTAEDDRGEQRAAELRRRIEETREALARLERELDALERGGEVPIR
jgi:serine protease Do